jgi:DNA invertase Pin-like site-specific DNA recombinase
MSSTKQQLIPAVAYVRKSTKGEKLDADGKKRERQEKSIQQQKDEILKLVKNRFELLTKEPFKDEGISGWKRGARRPDFQKMLDQVKELGAQAILCDNIDRFSRAAYDDVQEDASALRKAGVRYIVTVSHGEYDLGARYDIGDILKFVVAVWSACEFSRQMSRRITLSMRNRAEQGIRPAAVAPYGYELTGKRGDKKRIKPGDPKKVEVVQWLFHQCDKGASPNSLAGALNTRGIPASRGGKWTVKAVTDLLTNPVYVGDFRFNNTHRGHFHGIDGKREVVDSAELNGERHVFGEKGVYTAIIDRPLFNRVRDRLTARRNDRSLRKRIGYALTGILCCDHCKGGMHGTRAKPGGPVVYRCSANFQMGPGACGHRQVREDKVLPFVLKVLGEEIANLETLLAQPPQELVKPRKREKEERKQLERERDKLTTRISKAVKHVMLIEDAETRRDIDKEITAMRVELAKVTEQLATEPTVNGYTKADLDALAQWWEEFDAKAVSVPVSSEKNLKHAGGLLQDPFAEESAVRVDPKLVNEALQQLGCKVYLRWRTRTHTSLNDRSYIRHELKWVRYTLGQKSGKLASFATHVNASKATCTS